MSKNKKHPKLSRRTAERVLYILVILGLLLYGLLRDSEVAARLMEAITNAFSILIQNPL
jgi:hypothetical protein